MLLEHLQLFEWTWNGEIEVEARLAPFRAARCCGATDSHNKRSGSFGRKKRRNNWMHGLNIQSEPLLIT